MNERIRNNCDVFIENFKTAKKTYKLDGSLAACASALSLIGSSDPVGAERFSEAKKIINSNTHIFSTLGRGNARQVVMAAIAKSEDPEYAFSEIKKIHKMLDDLFLNSDYLVMAAVGIFSYSDSKKYEGAVKRTREVYKLIKKDHPFLTDSEDIPFCASMACCGKSPKEVTVHCEDIFRLLKPHYFSKNNIQSLACILSVFDGDAESKADRSVKVHKALKEQGFKFEGMSLPAEGVLAYVFEEDEIVPVIYEMKEAEKYLGAVRGLGNLAIGKKMRRVIAAAIVLETYSKKFGKNISDAAVRSIISTIIAQEMAMIACATSTAAASAAAASS